MDVNGLIHVSVAARTHSTVGQMGATAGQNIWGRKSPLPPSGIEPLIVYRSLVATDYESFNISSYILSVCKRGRIFFFF